MVLLSPWFLLALLPVAAVAIWTLIRPARRVLEVASLSLWTRAVAALEPRQSVRARRIPPSWACLLGGAVLAVLAASAPVFYSEVPQRRVAVAIEASTELSGPVATETMRDGVGQLLDRLAPSDRVQVVRPVSTGGATKWLSPADARAAVRDMAIPPVSADELDMPSLPEAQHVYRFVPAGGAEPADGPGVTTIELPTQLAPVGIERLGATELADGSVQVFVAIDNRSDRPVDRVSVTTARPGGGKTAVSTAQQAIEVIPPGQRGAAILLIDRVEGIAVAATDAGSAGLPGGRGFLARRRVPAASVALLGDDLPHVRRYISADEALELVASADEADLIIASGIEAPKGKPALLIEPPSAPAGWRRADDDAGPIVLADADVAGGDLLLESVNLTGVAIRRVRPWTAPDARRMVQVVGAGGGAVLLRTAAGPSDTEQPRRVYLAFSLHTENTNFPTLRAFPIFLANATRWLTGDRPARPQWGYSGPVQAGLGTGWRGVAGMPHPPGGASLTPPGLYVDSAGELHAVSLIGLSAGQPQMPPARAVAEAPLPEPAVAGVRLALWKGLILAAGIAWLVGWAMRSRGL